MHVAVKASLILAALVALVSIVFYLAGLHQNFTVGQILFLASAIAINVGVVYWALAKTAAENGYAGQLANAAIIGALGGVLVTLVSYILLSWVFPDVLGEMREAAIQFMDETNMPANLQEAQMEALGKTTAMSQSIPGGIGTFVTSLVTGAVVAIFKRRR